MTMPDERARALRFAGAFLREMLTREDVPDDLKHQARVTLRHYPTEDQLIKMTEELSRPIEGLHQIWLA